MLLGTIAPTVSEMVSARDTPSIVMASALMFHQHQHYQEVKDDAVTIPTTISGVPVGPSARAVPVVS